MALRKQVFSRFHSTGGSPKECHADDRCKENEECKGGPEWGLEPKLARPRPGVSDPFVESPRRHSSPSCGEDNRCAFQ